MTSDIYKIVIAAVIAAVLAAVIKKDNPVFAVLIVVAMSSVILIVIMPQLTAVFSVLNDISGEMGAAQGYVLTVLKIIGIAYISEFGAQLCIDAGETALAANVGVAGKVIIMGVSAPIMVSLLNQILLFIPV